MKKEVRDNYFLLSALALLLFLSYKIISPYLIAVINAFILAYLIKPLYSLINKKFNKPISAITSMILAALVFIIPAYFVIKKIATETIILFSNINMNDLTNEFSQIQWIQTTGLGTMLNNLISYLTNLLTSMISHLPSLILGLVITALGTYYILTNWEKLAAHIENFIPVEDKKQKIEEIKQKTNGIIYGMLLKGIVESLFCLIGFYVIGVNDYLFMAMLIFFSALIPGTGAGFVLIPLAVYYLLIGQTQTFIGILIISAITIYLIDMYIGTKVLGNKTKTNPFLMFLGILGGISVFGIFGFIIGPLILIYTIELVEQFIKN